MVVQAAVLALVQEDANPDVVELVNMHVKVVSIHVQVRAKTLAAAPVNIPLLANLCNPVVMLSLITSQLDALDIERNEYKK